MSFPSLRITLTATLTILLALAAVAIPATATLHALEHVEAAADTGGSSDSEGEESSCEDCQAFSQVRNAFALDAFELRESSTLQASGDESEQPLLACRVPHAPDAPRAPPQS